MLRRYAAWCRYLRLTLSADEMGDLDQHCTHMVREGMRCPGPFLEETETSCGLWEPSERYREMSR